MIGSGVAAAIGIIQVAGTLLLGTWYPFQGGALWAITLAVWSAHGVSFIGLLLRRAWSRTLSALLSLGWVAVLVWQIVDGISRDHRIDPVESLVITGLAALFLALGLYLLVSKRTRAAFDIK